MSMTYENLGLDPINMSSMDYDNYDPVNLPKLPPDEEKLWYARFYYQGRSEAAPQIAATVKPGNPMDPQFALLPGHLDRLTKPGHIKGDLGYCLLPDGAGYGSTFCDLPQVSFDMYKWYKKLRMVDSLSYKIWYPGSHMSELNGITIEDVGFGRERFEIQDPLGYKDLGFSGNPAEKDPDYLGLIASNCWIHNEEYAEVKPRAMLLIHYMRRSSSTGAQGMEFRTHIYIGMHCKAGQGVVVQNIEPELCLEITRRMIHHCVYERNNLNSYLPELYEKMKDMEIKEPETLADSFPIEE